LLQAVKMLAALVQGNRLNEAAAAIGYPLREEGQEKA